MPTILFLLLASCRPVEDNNALTAFLALETHEKIKFLKDGYFRRTITPRVNAAQVCLAVYRNKNPAIDAAIEAKRPDPRFYFDFFDGYAAGFDGPGLPSGCVPKVSDAGVAEGGWQSLNQFDSVTGDTGPYVSIFQRCNKAAVDYASRFNIRLAKLRPDRVHLACKNRPTVVESARMMADYQQSRAREAALEAKWAAEKRLHPSSPPPVLPPPPVIAPPSPPSPPRY